MPAPAFWTEHSIADGETLRAHGSSLAEAGTREVTMATQILCRSTRFVRPGRIIHAYDSDMAKQDRGFASMDRDKQRQIASSGGKAAHAKGLAHEWNAEEARVAGRKGARNRRRQSTPSDDTQQT